MPLEGAGFGLAPGLPYVLYSTPTNNIHEGIDGGLQSRV